MPRLDAIYLESADGFDLYADGARLVWSVALMTETTSSGYDAEHYAAMLSALLPTGPAWPRHRQSTLQALLLSLAAELGRIDARSVQLVAEVDPSTTSELLGDWERVVGLPDGCVTAVQSVAERRMALESRLTAVGSQSRRFFIELASRMGYSITIDEFRSAAEANAAGLPVSGDDWAHTWRVTLGESVGVRFFRAGSGSAGEALKSWGNEAVECQINRYKPAHTRVLFAYSD